MRAAKGAPLGYLLRRQKVWGLVLGFASYNYTFYLLLTWLPSYLSSTHHIDLRHSIFYTSVPWLFATVTDILMGGWLVDKLVQRGRDPSFVRRAILIGGTTLGLGVVGAAYAQSTTTAYRGGVHPHVRVIFERQGNEASPVAEKIRGPHHESL